MLSAFNSWKSQICTQKKKRRNAFDGSFNVDIICKDMEIEG